jgi:hypothetical protein
VCLIHFGRLLIWLLASPDEAQMILVWGWGLSLIKRLLTRCLITLGGSFCWWVAFLVVHIKADCFTKVNWQLRSLMLLLLFMSWWARWTYTTTWTIAFSESNISLANLPFIPELFLKVFLHVHYVKIKSWSLSNRMLNRGWGFRDVGLMRLISHGWTRADGTFVLTI